MSVGNTLVVWSNYYQDLAQQQLDSCLQVLDRFGHAYTVETVDAGTYEIPAVIRYYQNHHPHAAYLPLSLLLKGSTDHYDFIWEHIKTCFIQFTMEGILLGNGIITAPSMEIMIARVNKQERVTEAVQAIDYLLRMQQKHR